MSNMAADRIRCIGLCDTKYAGNLVSLFRFKQLGGLYDVFNKTIQTRQTLSKC